MRSGFSICWISCFRVWFCLFEIVIFWVNVLNVLVVMFVVFELRSCFFFVLMILFCKGLFFFIIRRLELLFNCFCIGLLNWIGLGLVRIGVGFFLRGLVSLRMFFFLILDFLVGFVKVRGLLFILLRFRLILLLDRFKFGFWMVCLVLVVLGCFLLFFEMIWWIEVKIFFIVGFCWLFCWDIDVCVY